MMHDHYCTRCDDEGLLYDSIRSGLHRTLTCDHTPFSGNANRLSIAATVDRV